MYLPRFNAEYGQDLTKQLLNLGIKTAFTPNADFSSMSETPFVAGISSIVHKAFIKVDEEGTEAGAVTFSMYVGGRDPEPTFQMIVDHPFIYVIRDNTTGAILFMGITMKP